MSRAAELQYVSRETGATLYLRDGPEQVARDAAHGRLPETQPWWFRQTIWKYDVRDALAPIRPGLRVIDRSTMRRFS